MKPIVKVMILYYTVAFIILYPLDKSAKQYMDFPEESQLIHISGIITKDTRTMKNFSGYREDGIFLETRNGNKLNIYCDDLTNLGSSAVGRNGVDTQPYRAGNCYALAKIKSQEIGNCNNNIVCKNPRELYGMKADAKIDKNYRIFELKVNNQLFYDYALTTNYYRKLKQHGMNTGYFFLLFCMPFGILFGWWLNFGLNLNKNKEETSE